MKSKPIRRASNCSIVCRTSRSPDASCSTYRCLGLTGLELQSRLAERGSLLPIIFVTGHSDTPTTVRAIKAGAEDFLTKPASSEQLIGAIERAMVRFESASNQRSELDAFRGLVATLTPRERQVFGLIVRGKINKQIAL